MKRIDLTQTIQILANVGVIAGIIFLAVELRQNNQLLAAQARATNLASLSSFANDILATPSLAAALARKDAGEPLSDAEELQLYALALSVVSQWQWRFVEYQAGMLGEADLQIPILRRIYAGGGRFKYPVAAAFQDSRSGLDPAFVAWMEENVVNADLE